MTRPYLIMLTPLLLFGAVFLFIRYITCIFMNPKKAWHIALMLDEADNVGANGEVNTTISARAARARNAGRRWGCLLCWLLDRIQSHHCDNSLKDRP